MCRGEGPTLLECKTWRRGSHAQREIPPPERRPTDRIEHWTARDPVLSFEQRLTERGLLDAAQLAEIRQSINRALDEAVAFAEASPFPEPEEALADVFAE